MKNSIISTILVLMVSSFFFSCGGSDEPGSIYGVASDKATGEPINNAGIELLPVGLKTVTGSDGSFEFLGISSGHYNLLATKIGYKDTKSSIINVESGKVCREDIHLEKEPAALRIVDDAKNDIKELDFGDKLDDVSRSFNIFNDSPKSFEWEITKTAEWIISISQESGELAAGDTQGIIVEIDRSLLREGENLSQLHITAINNGDKRLTIKATDSDACKNNPCGEHGTCKATGAKTYKCICDEGYFSDEIKCVDPCADGPCIGVENATGKCVAKDAFSYSCECNDTFSWDGNKCLNPCDPNPCEGLEHSNGICSKEDAFTLYSCGCIEGFFWSGEECLNPCESNPCSDKENSTGICNAIDAKTYSCECEDTFTWNENIKKCQNPCEPNPCAGIENSTERCVKIDNFTKYSCECEETFTWNENIKKCQNPCEPNPCAGIENSPEICVKEDEFTQYSCKCYKNFIWNGTQCACSIPECSPTSNTPCVDSTSKLIWSSISSGWMDWEGAVEYCNNLSEGDFADWHLPTISELRTLIKNCPGTEPNGACRVADGCLAGSCWSDACGCTGIYNSDGYYSKLGDSGTAFWSSSTQTDYDNFAWLVGWDNGGVGNFPKTGSDSYGPVRCVRKKTGSCF